MALRLYSTLTNRKELFEAAEPGRVGIYVCGPTVYKESHIGHAVGPVIFDALKKYLTYKGFKVKLVINITDVDDKLINESNRLGIVMDELAQRVTATYFDALDRLGVNSVDHFPCATEHISDIIELIQRLGENDAAYIADGDVYFDISKCRDYGKLSNRRSDDQVDGSRELSGTGKRHPGDFVLWKTVEPDEPGWDSPWGRGRPGWHIECSAMSMKFLGETFDIHGGGIDLIFPHHENEIAQAEIATGKPFARYWLHNGLTRIRTKLTGGELKNEKMSKSLGNIRPLGELLKQYPPQCLRFFLLSTHYRRPIDFSDDAIRAVQKGLANIHRLLERVARLSGQDVYDSDSNPARMEELAQNDTDRDLVAAVTQAQLHYLEALDDDFNTAGAIAVLFELCGKINRYIDEQRLEIQPRDESRAMVLEAARMVSSLGHILGLLEGPVETAAPNNALADKLMGLLIELRAQARRDKNFTLADVIRDRLKELKIILEDRPGGDTDWHMEN